MSVSIRDWITQRGENGYVTFSLEDVRSAFPHFKNTHVSEELSRLRARRIIQAPHRGFFVIIPTGYKKDGLTPPTYYIDAMMRQLNRPYYIAGLSAAAIWGAAHQRPMRTFVMTRLPVSSMSRIKNDSIVWIYRKDVPTSFLVQKNGEMGPVSYSNPEMTALDLVQYSDKFGGLSSVSTTLAELREFTSFKGAVAGLLRYTNNPTIQRLGYIYDEILGDHEQADVLNEEWRRVLDVQPRTVLLSTLSSVPTMSHNKKWLIDVNSTIEIDDV